MQPAGSVCARGGGGGAGKDEGTGSEGGGLGEEAMVVHGRAGSPPTVLRRNGARSKYG